MKKNTMDKIYHALLSEQPELLLSADLLKNAVLPIQKMLAISKTKGII
jgi:quinolinate synthase